MAGVSHLLALPVELQLAICHQLLQCQTESGSSMLLNAPILRNLGFTCKHLRQITAPLLLHRVRVSVAAPAAFFRAILHFSCFPDDVALVRELTIDSHRAVSHSISGDQSNFLIQEANRQGLSVYFMVRGLDDRYPPLTAVLTAVLLCQLSTIRKLRLLIPGVVTREMFMDRGRMPESFRLDSLRHLEMYPVYNAETSSRSGLPTKTCLAGVLRHTPALTYLGLEPCVPCTQGVPTTPGIISDPFELQRERTLIRCLRKHLGEVAGLCPKLKTLRTGPADCAHPSCEEVDDEVLTATVSNSRSWESSGSRACDHLLPLAARLRDLDLGHALFMIQDIEEAVPISSSTSLRSLRLVFAKWPSGDNAALIDSLSPGLESLCLGGRGIPLHSIAVLLGSRIRNGRLPGMRCFRYRLLGDEELEAGMAEKIATAFAGTGVDWAEEWYPPQIS